jgi:murein L,D-transpeptidase YcbB/YkuD
VEDEKVVLRKRVIVGREYRPTPVFSDRITYLVFNPTWTVPWKIAVNDKLPALRRDPSRFVAAGYEFFNGRGRERERVDPLTVDWSKVTKRNFNYRLVQRAGRQNALGQIKFMFPNKFGVYLHDTPGRELFAEERRAFSSGCVRVQEPVELAAFALAGQGDWTREKIDAVIDAFVTQTVELETPLPVYMVYWTSWIDEDGTLQFRNDLYGLDPPLRAALGESFESR